MSIVSLNQTVKSPSETGLEKSGLLKPSALPAPSETMFADAFASALDKVAEAQQTAKVSAEHFELGKTEDLAAVMVDQQVASLGFQLTLQVRNKALSAYKDIMNMPV